ncbi:MAG: ActS/PrrB/RegB family redox-sensitive histidine kinase [Rhizobiaceae bacterium]|nr:ActS/PrrB/RegB family redox-sensitive histidine kinase [Rhizobiaceae bacterium]
MEDENYQPTRREEVLVRLDTFLRLRRYAIIGQGVAILLVAFWFQYPFQWEICLGLIAISAGLNVVLDRLYQANHLLPGSGAMMLLSFDVVHLGLLLFLTGGLQNPFAILLMAPVVVAATSLHLDHILSLWLLTLLALSVLVIFHLPLPWNEQEPLDIPFVYNLGVWLAIVCTAAFTAIYAYRVAEESRKLADALAATELVLQREEYLSDLDGLAAAAAHELGTPLATIALVAKEMVHELGEASPLRDDALLLRAQADRCRDILQKLSSLTSAGEEVIGTQTLGVLVEEEVAPLRDFGIDIEVHSKGNLVTIPTMGRNAGIHYGLGNLLDNAVDFAREKVVVVMYWDEETVSVEISDDGPGFPASLLERLGDPFLTGRPDNKGAQKRGLGLGVFIAKTLLERSGAQIGFQNHIEREHHGGGAFIELKWPRDKLQA